MNTNIRVKLCPRCGQETHPSVARCSRCREWLGGAGGCTLSDRMDKDSPRTVEERITEDKSLLRRQNFYQAKVFSLLLYPVIFSIIPSVILFVSSVEEGKMNLSVIAFVAILICSAIHTVFLYQIRKFVNKNFIAAENFSLMWWGTALSFFVFLILGIAWAGFDYVASNDHKMLIKAFTALSVAVYPVFLVLLYEEVRDSVAGFSSDIPWFTVSYDMQGYPRRRIFGSVIITSFLFLIKTPYVLYRLFSEAEAYTREYGYLPDMR